MERLACVNIPVLALQVLLHEHKNWRGEPVVVVDQDTAKGRVLQANREAAAFNIRPGMRFAAARSLCTHLRAGEVSDEMLTETVKKFHAILFEFSPEISHGRWSALIPEDSIRFAGVAWLRVTGLDVLFGSFEQWSTQLFDALQNAGLTPNIAIGYSRFASYVLAKNPLCRREGMSVRTGVVISPNLSTEHDLLLETPLDVLDVDPKVLDALGKLGIKSLGEFLRLPPSSVQKRFGLEARALWEEATNIRDVPLQPIRYTAPIEARVSFDEAQWDSTRLLFIIKQHLHTLCLKLGVRSHDLNELTIAFRFEDGDVDDYSFRPASPSLDEVKILELIRLRMDRFKFQAPIVGMHMTAHGSPYHREQMNLLFDAAKRDNEVTQHAIAQVQAEFGDVVKRAVIKDENFPEDSFELVDYFDRASQRDAGGPVHSNISGQTLIRRILNAPQPISWFREDLPTHQTIRSIEEGGLQEQLGPYAVSGNWWTRWSFRDYRFVKTKRGDIYWLFYDQRKKQWYLHGWCE